MATIADVKHQGEAIKNLIFKLQDTLKSNQLVTHFRENPADTQAILDATAQMKTRHLVLNGLKEALRSTVLPAREALAIKAQNWLEEGDVIAGWNAGLTEPDSSPHVSARVILGVSDDGYSWRWLEEDEDVTRNPVRLDPWFQDPGWVKLTTIEDGLEMAIDSVYEQQQAEIDGLLEQISYFESKSFLIEE